VNDQDRLARSKIAIDARLKRRDQQLAREQLELQKADFELRKRTATADGFHFLLTPTGVVLMGAALGLIGTALGKAADYAIKRRELETNIILKSSDVPSNADVNVQARQRALNLLWFAQAGYIALSDDYLSKLRATANVDEGQAVPPPVIASTASATNYTAEDASLVEAATKTKAAAWMRVAQGEIGQREIPGPESNPRIAAYNKAAGLPADDAVPWVGSFMCWTFKQVGKPCPAAPGRALSWENWGQEIEDPVLGAIVIMQRDTRLGAGSGAVGFYLSEKPQSVRVLMGNAYDQVTAINFPRAQVKSYRLPPD
jgi:uncharacterized protein (TIGR02594 family)